LFITILIRGACCTIEYQVGLLNVDGFYDPLLSFIDLAVSEGFITEEARQIIISAPTVKELVMKLEVRSQLYYLSVDDHNSEIGASFAQSNGSWLHIVVHSMTDFIYNLKPITVSMCPFAGLCP
jgi:hypothetical protein